MIKGLILAAGYGSRFFPITKQIPKELLPLVNRPALDFIIEEFTASGITDICVVISPHKRLIQRYYQPVRWLERALASAGKSELARQVAPPRAAAGMRFVYQKTMQGSGHAMLQARKFVGSRAPVVIAYPDDLHFGTPPLAQQLIKHWQTHQRSAIAAIPDPPNPERYGMLVCDEKTRQVHDVIEKPPVTAIPSRYASIGRYLVAPQFFDYLLAGWQTHRRVPQAERAPEYYHIAALRRLIAADGVDFITIPANERLDIGEPGGYAQAVQHYQTLLEARP